LTDATALRRRNAKVFEDLVGEVVVDFVVSWNAGGSPAALTKME
jgi:hypothetical protein